MANKMSEKKKSASASEIEEPKARSKPVRRETKSFSSSSVSSKKPGGFRNWRIVRFTREAYRELRYKVTWPTFQEARNMTIVVIVLSTIVGVVLGGVDRGLFQLFTMITGK